VRRVSGTDKRREEGSFNSLTSGDQGAEELMNLILDTCQIEEGLRKSNPSVR